MRSHILSGLTALLLLGAAPAANAQQIASVADINNLSLEQLSNVEITTVSKTAQPLSDAAAAAYVITHDDVIRSGATSIPEMLRLAPNLEVMQTSPSNYEITARGFNGNANAQNFSDKLLVLIDGRSVYSPLYSGVYWDMQDVLPQDIERIEVVSGPGGTLWGANAVNGVVNIVTRKSADTQGGFIDLGAGNLESSAAIQYGGKLDDAWSYRVYAKDFYDHALDSSTSGANAHDGWAKPQGGFRLDWSGDTDSATLQGDLYGGAEAQAGAANELISGGNVTAHWDHPLGDGSTLQTLAYYDEARRSALNGGAFVLDTYDLEIQHSFNLGSWNNIIWGAGDRIYWYNITSRIAPDSSLLFIPNQRTLNLANLFAEDHIPLGNRVELSLGLKLENDPYSGISPMPSGRLSWKVDDNDLVWAAVSRAVRSPTPFDTDVEEKLGAANFLIGNPNFLPEDVTAYELGYRGQFLRQLSLSLSLYDDVYDDLKSIEFTPTVFPLQWGNMMEGRVYGMETWVSYQAADWWRLSAGFTLQHEDFKFRPGASQLLGLPQQGDDPHHQASLRSSMSLSDDINFDADLRDVGVLANPKVPEYVELNSRLGWRVSERLELSLSGFNLLHARHLEYQTGSSDEVARSVFVETKWHF